MQAIGRVELSLSGFTEDELDKLLESLDVREKRERPEAFDVDAALEAARAATRANVASCGALGDHRLLIGDAGDVTRLLGETRPAMCFTDPPYNVALGDHGGQQRGSRKRRIHNDAMAPEEWEDSEPLMAAVARLSDRSAVALAVILCAGGGLALPLALHWSMPGLVAANVVRTSHPATLRC